MVDTQVTLMIKGERAYRDGLYCPKMNLIVMYDKYGNGPLERGLLEHEMRHACGDLLGE